MFRKMFVSTIHWFFFLSALHAAASNPETRVRLAGEALELMCAFENRPVFLWDFTPHSDPTKSRIIGSGRNNSQPVSDRDRFRVDCNTPGSCRLVINDIKLTDAGLYRCLVTTPTGLLTKPVANLTVLAAVPTCTTVVSYKTSYLLDGVKIRCQVNYSGTQQPFIHCRELSSRVAPSPATPVEIANSSYRSLSFTYDIDVDRIADETKFECATSLNMKDFPHGHAQYIWSWPDVTTENREQPQSSSRFEVSTTTNTGRVLGEPSSSSAGVLVGIGIIVAMFAIFMLAVIVILGRLAMKGVLCSSHGQRCCSPGTTLSASLSGHGVLCSTHDQRRYSPNTTLSASMAGHEHMFGPTVELCAISDNISGPVPALPSRSHAIVAENGIRTSCQLMSNVVIENNEISDNAPSVNPTYAELSVSIRTDTSQRLTRSTDTSHAVYADINHFQTNNKKRTPPDTF